MLILIWNFISCHLLSSISLPARLLNVKHEISTVEVFHHKK